MIGGQPGATCGVHFQKYGFDFDILVWRSISVLFLKTYIHGALLGKQILALIYRLEERFPHLAGRLGQYPMFIIKKWR